MEIKTICVHGKENTIDYTGAVSTPIYQSATFAHKGVGMSTGYDYSRLQNPTREKLESLIRDLEVGVDAIAFSTGMAAVTALMETFNHGDHIIASDDLYGGSVRLFNNICAKNVISVEYVNTSYIDEITAKIKPETRAIYIETPTNPLLQVTDIAACSEIAKEHNLLLIVDNTFLTPYFQNPLRLGADIVIHSGTKFLGGHNDTLAGFLVVNSEELSEKLRFIAKTIGACLAPFDSWLIMRGIKTLAVRMDRIEENTIKLANWLSTRDEVKKVYYTGFESHPQYNISVRQAKGFGGIISFEVESERIAVGLLNNLKLIYFAESLGGTETLMTYPFLQTHADVPEEVRKAKGINECLLRISVGIEDIEDIITDLKNSFKKLLTTVD